MKRLIVAVALLVLIPVFIFIEHAYLKNSTSEMIGTLQKAEQLAAQGQQKEAAQQVAAFQKKWNRNKTIMSTFIRHAELDTVHLSAARLLPYLDNDDIGDFCAESDSLVVQLQHIWESEKFSVDNVL